MRAQLPILDEDDFASDSDQALVTQQSAKAYMDTLIGTVDSLADILALGNTSGGTDLIISAGDQLTTDTISETTSAAGVTVDGVLLKDGGIDITGDLSFTPTTGTALSFGALTAIERLSSGGAMRIGVDEMMIIGAGEAAGQMKTALSPWSNERLYLGAEGGVYFATSPDNWSSSWAGRNEWIFANTGVSTFPGDITVGGAVTATGALTGNAAKIDVPGDYWSSGDFYDVSGFGHLSSDGGFAVSLTSNGYRDTGGLWVSQAVDGNTGAASITLNPAGSIAFRAETAKNTGDPHTITAIGVWSPSTFTVSTADLVLSAGDLTVSAGNAVISAGTLSVTSGTTDGVALFKSTDANAYIRLEDSATTTGVVAVGIGAIGDDLVLRAGETNHLRLYSTGDLTLATGDFTVSAGDLTLSAGSIEIANNATGQTAFTQIPTLRLTNTDTTATASNVVGSFQFYSKDASEPDKVVGFMESVAEDAGTKYGLSWGVKTTAASAVERMTLSSDGDLAVLAGNATITGNLYLHQSAGDIILRSTNGLTDVLTITTSGNDGYIVSQSGGITLRPSNTAGLDLDLSAAGDLTLQGGDFAVSAGDIIATAGAVQAVSVVAGGSLYMYGSSIQRGNNTGGLNIYAGNTTSTAANIEMYGGAHASYPGQSYYDSNRHTFRVGTVASASYSTNALVIEEDAHIRVQNGNFTVQAGDVKLTGAGSLVFDGATSADIVVNGTEVTQRVYEATTIADDAVGSFIPPQYGCWVTIGCQSTAAFPQITSSCQIWVDTGTSLQIVEAGYKGSNVDLVTTDVTGTDGTDGKVTVAVQAGVVKIENRSGGSLSFTVKFTS